MVVWTWWYTYDTFLCTFQSLYVLACGYIRCYYIASDMVHYIYIYYYIYTQTITRRVWNMRINSVSVFRFGVDQLLYSIILSILLLHSWMSLIGIFIFEHCLSYFAILSVTDYHMLSCFYDQYQKVLVYSVDYLFTAHTYNIVCSYISKFFDSRMSIHLFWLISSFVCFLRPLLGGRKRSPYVSCTHVLSVSLSIKIWPTNSCFSIHQVCLTRKPLWHCFCTQKRAGRTSHAC